MKKRKNLSSVCLWLLVVLLIFVISITTIYSYKSLKLQLFTERQSHLTEMTTKISEVIDITIETMQEKVNSANTFIEQSEIKEVDATDFLSSLADMLFVGNNNGILLAMDDQGRYYSSEGKNGLWSNMQDLVAQENKPVIRDISIFGEKKACMVFFSKLSEGKGIRDDDSELSHVALAIPLDSMSDYLSITMFADESYTYLINRQGRRLYEQTNSRTFIEDFNVISALKEDEFLMGGDIENLISSVNERERFCAEFQDAGSGENYFVSTVPVSGSDWTVLLFVPTKVLGVRTTEFMKSVVTYFIGFALACIVTFACLIYMILKNRNDKKMIEQQMHNNELLEQSAEEARKANLAKSEFLAHMSHDIRTPINGIIGMTHIAINSLENSKKVEDCLNKISGAANHLLTLVNDVLDMSSIESGKVVISHGPLDIRMLVNNCASIVEGQIATRNLEFRMVAGEFAHPYVLGDELHLRQVFINILGNAVKFTPDGGNIEFRVQEISGTDETVMYRFEFEDNGIGISKEFLGKIFDEFSQEAKDSRSTYQGTGLGMAISRKFVEYMGGSIHVQSEPGKGSCFTVEIPFEINTKYQEETVSSQAIHLQGIRVLLAEDNELNMEIAMEILAEKGVKVIGAENGQIAVEKFVSSDPGYYDAILMDVMMPVMNGYDAARAIRRCPHPEAGSIPIIAMTANAYREDVEKAIDAGMNAHIAKPIDIERLFLVLEQYCNGTDKQ
jgi:signal transduction histidine kinase/CheY-like chemotaxis protein